MENKNDSELKRKKLKALKDKPKRPNTPFQRYMNLKKDQFTKLPNKLQLLKKAYEKQDPLLKQKLEKEYKEDW